MLCNSVVPNAGGAYPPQVQQLLRVFFDLGLAQSAAPFTPDERSIVDMLTARLAHVEGLRVLLTGAKLALIMEDLAAAESSFSAIQDVLVSGQGLAAPAFLQTVAGLEQQLRAMLADLQQYTAPQPDTGAA